MKLYAIADLHLGHAINRQELAKLAPHRDDGLILCGDVGETAAHLALAFSTAKANFREVFWCPGNHELYSIPTATARSGEDKYHECLEVAHEHGVRTPEDAFFRWGGEGGPVLIAPIFTLYDYSFRPAHVRRENAVRWAEEADTLAADEYLIRPDPHASVEDWCEALVARSERRLEEASHLGMPLIIANHWPLRQDLVHIPRVPRFLIWCGTRKTEDWHTRFDAKVVVSGHLHVRRTDWKDGVRFEECSLGYPAQWDGVRKAGKDINHLLREILPGPSAPASGSTETQWRGSG